MRLLLAPFRKYSAPSEADSVAVPSYQVARATSRHNPQCLYHRGSQALAPRSALFHIRFQYQSFLTHIAGFSSLRLPSAVEDGDDTESNVEQGYWVGHKATHILHFADSTKDGA